MRKNRRKLKITKRTIKVCLVLVIAIIATVAGVAYWTSNIEKNNAQPVDAMYTDEPNLPEEPETDNVINEVLNEVQEPEEGTNEVANTTPTSTTTPAPTNLENYKNRFNPFLNYKSIGLFHNKKKYENKSYVNDEKDKNITLKNFDNLITSKIYNKDDSRNNKNILKIITGEKNFYDTKYNDTLTNSLHNKTKKLDVHLSIEKINLPKINKNKITKIM